MRKLCLLTAAILLAGTMWAQDNASKANSELQKSTDIVQHMTSTAGDKSIPREVLEGAKCVAVIPELIKGAFIVGGEHGTGVATCRTSSGWSAPAPFAVSGVSWGPQIGGKSTSLLMFIMNAEGMNSLMSGHFKVGANVSAAAGPVGRDASAEAGWKAGILTYSQSKGAFIGASLAGAEIQQDDSKTRELYGRDVKFQDILSGKANTPNQQARAFVSTIENAKQTAEAQH